MAMHSRFETECFRNAEAFNPSDKNAMMEGPGDILKCNLAVR